MIGGMFKPAGVLSSRTMQRVLPVPRLVAANEAIGSCLRYATDGSFVLEACPPALAGMADNATEYKAPKGEHEAGMFTINPNEPPPGYQGEGGYWHVREAHITRVLTSQLGSGRLGALQVDRLDALCHDVSRSGDRVVVDRAYVGCAVIADGTSAAPASSDLAMQQLQAQGRRLGAPKEFRIDGGSGLESTCDGEGAETTVTIGVVALSTICDQIVRDAILSKATKDAATALADIEKVKAELAAKQLTRPQGDARDRAGREKVGSLAASIIALDMQVEALRTRYEQAVETERLYRGDPYGLRRGDRLARHE